jgi:hypothetical protein
MSGQLVAILEFYDHGQVANTAMVEPAKRVLTALEI